MKNTLPSLLAAVIALLALRVAAAAEPAPLYVDAQAIADRFATITAEDMALLRSKKILLGGQSHSLLLRSGLKLLAQQDKKYEFLGPTFEIVPYDDKTESKLPPDVFTYAQGNYVQFGLDVHRWSLRYDEMDTLIRGEKFGFGRTVDAALILEHTNCSREDFEYYAKKFAKLQADFPQVRFIYTTGVSVPNRVKVDWMQEDGNAFAAEMQARYRGKAPLLDLHTILNENYRYGYGLSPKYSASVTADPNEFNLHPYLPAGQLALAKGFLLVLRDAFRAPWPPPPLDPVTPGDRKLADKKIETIPADHPDALAVRALLDANGLQNKKVEDVAVVKGGRIVKLYIMGLGVENLTRSIGDLTELQELLVYGFRSPWKLPLLKTVDPALGQCTKLEVLALNSNELTTLPDALTHLTKLKILSVGDNHLQHLSPAVTDLVQRLDPRGLALQNDVPAPTPQVPSPADQPKSRAGATTQSTAASASSPATAATTTPALPPAEPGATPMYVDAQAIEERFATITAEDMAMLRSKKILLGGQSLTPILDSGLKLLAQKDKKYQFLSPNFQPVPYDAKTESKLPPEYFTYSNGNYVHFYIDVHQYKLRYDEMDTLIRGEKFGFGSTVDAALIVEHTNCSREDFEYYAKKFDKLQADFPKVRFIYTTGISVPNSAKVDWMQEDSNGFAAEIRARYQGKVPLWDLQKVLDDNFRYGYGTCPNYCPSSTNDPNALNLHPSLPAGQLVVAKGFLLVLRDAFRAPWPPKPLGPVTPDGRTQADKKIETIPADHPDAKAVRALLDANGLTDKKVEDVAVVKGGRIVKLYIMGLGVENLTRAIGDLTELKQLLVYGFRSPWKLPLLKTVDPALGQCTKLEVLALNSNELTTLPDSLTRLPNLRILSVADNPLQNLSPALTALVKRLDGRSLTLQNDVPSPAPPVPSPAPQPPSPTSPAPSPAPQPQNSPPATASATTRPLAVADRDSLPLMPDQDPPAAGAPVKLLPGLENKHPRLFLTAEQLPQLRDFYHSPAAADYRQQFLTTLKTCVPPKSGVKPWSRGWVDGINGIAPRTFMPMVALHYLLTGDKTSLARAQEYLQNLAGTANWCTGDEPAVENTPEAYAKVLAAMKKMPPHADFYNPVNNAVNADPHAAYLLFGAALAWDWLYPDLDPAFREQFRRILWEHARALYYGGYRAGSSTRFGRQYWNAYVAYNHRSSMDMGLALGLLAATEGKPEEQWMLGNLQKELDFLETNFAPDGSQRIWDQPVCEAGLALQVADDCLGTHHLDAPFFRHTSTFMLQATAPGFGDRLFMANDPKMPAIDEPFMLKLAAHFQQADQLDGIRQSLKKVSGPFSEAGMLVWLALLSDDPQLQNGHLANLPTSGFYPDLGLSFMRDSWQDKAVAASIKCGPPGGYHYVTWRLGAEKSAMGPLTQCFSHGTWPNSNMFILFGDGDCLAECDRGGSGRTSSYNTILINKIGQTEPWRHDGAEWEPWAPADKVDVRQMAVITAYKDAGDVVVTEGEAAGSYGAYDDAKTNKKRPALDRFRRDFIWVKGGYILVLDDVRAPQPVETTWLVQGAKLEPVAEDQKKYRLSQNQAHCDFQLLADTDFQTVLGVSTAAAPSWTGKPLNWQQLQASATAPAVRWVSIYNPWHHPDLKLTFTPTGPDQATITVTGSGMADTWQWASAKGKFEAATLHGTRPQGFDVLVDAQTAVPPPHD